MFQHGDQVDSMERLRIAFKLGSCDVKRQLCMKCALIISVLITGRALWQKNTTLSQMQKGAVGAFSVLGGIFKSFVAVPNHGVFVLTHSNKK